jgi:hypothetical protein
VNLWGIAQTALLDPSASIPKIPTEFTGSHTTTAAKLTTGAGTTATAVTATGFQL